MSMQSDDKISFFICLVINVMIIYLISTSFTVLLSPLGTGVQFS